MERARRELEEAEKILRGRTPVGPDAEGVIDGFDDLVQGCATAVDDLRQLEVNLQRETGVSTSDPHIVSIVQRWQRLQTTAIEKNYRMGTNRKLWTQCKADMHALQCWLSEAETLQSTQRTTPSSIQQLEAAVCSHKEFLVQLDNKKPVILSMNLVNKDVITRCPATDETRVFGEQLDSVNTRWDRCCAKAALWQKELQIALLHGVEFHNSLSDLNTWLSTVETHIEAETPLDLLASKAALRHKSTTLQSLMSELEKAQPRIASYQQTADELLDKSDMSDDSLDLRMRMEGISMKLMHLLQICTEYVQQLDGSGTMTFPSLPSSDVDVADGLRHSTSPQRTVTSTPSPASRRSISPYKSRYSRI